MQFTAHPFSRQLIVSLALLVASSFSALAIRITASSFGSGTFGLNDSVSYRVVVQGTEPTTFGAVTFEGPFACIVYARGTDIYGNPVFIEIQRRTLTGLRGRVVSGNLVVEEPTDITLEGAWVIPNDGTLHNTVDTYTLVVAIYPTTTFPTILTPPLVYTPPPFALDQPLLAAASGAGIFINVVPDIAMNSPGAVYKAGEYRGKDIIPITTSWRNDSRGEPGRQSRPIGLIGDGYSMSLRLSTDGEFAESTTAANDDFSFYSYALGGDLGGLIADGTTDFRQVIVTGTPGAVPPYGITGIPATQRVYFPQPDDGFLDIGESVDWVVQTMIPENYASDGYFVTSRVRMDPERDADAGNNTFTSNGADKIAILETASPSIEPMSAVTTETGGYVQGGNAASDGGAVSEDGSAVVFISRATNLLAPASGSGTTVPTTGQQVFLKQPSTGEVDLISGPGVGLVSANADCFNPTISANGRYIAYDSAASNILPSVFTAAKSMIYVFDRTTGETVIVSRNSDGALADGSSFNPKLSESGRFVVFESTASNLDLPKVTPVITAGAITSYTIDRPGSGYPLAPASPPTVTIASTSGSGAAATAVVGPTLVPPMVVGGISQITPGSGGSGYSNATTTVTVAAPPAGPKQVYLHDRDSDADGVFDETGQTATYLVSGEVRNVPGGGTVVERSDNVSYAPVVSLDDSNADLGANTGLMYVAYASYASNLPDQNIFGSMVYRAAVRVTGPADQRGLFAVQTVSVNNDGDIPALTPAETAAGFKPDSYQPSINGDGSQVAFTSWGSNLVYNPTTGGFDADTNGVQDVFVRDFKAVPASTVRVSVSQERVATGILAFVGAVGADNVPISQPAPGDTITLGDGVDEFTFIFDPVNPLQPDEIAVPIGATVQETRDNLIDQINGAGMRLQAFVTTPPNEDPGTSYVAAIYLRNTVPGEAGNVPITVVSANLVLSAAGMTGGGSQATDAPVAVQGVPFGSSEPSIDRSGRFVAFRTIAENLDVHTRTAANNYDGSPITGELIRPLIFPTSNVYVRDRLADGDRGGAYDIPANSKTTRVSVNKFGYPTFYGGTQSGVGSPLTANNATPMMSANGRFVVFSSDAEGQGGLVFGPNNLSPLDNDRIRSVFLHDRRTLSDDPPPPSSRPVVNLTSPPEGLHVPPGSTISLSATALPAAGKQINNVQFYVNGSAFGPALTEEPYALTYRLPTAGRYSVRVVATDSKGISSSDAAFVTAGPPLFGASPTVSITQPTSQISNYIVGSRIVLNALAEDIDGTVTGVVFYLNGQPYPATEGFDGNWYAQYRPDTVGSFSLFATATDDKGNTSLSEISTIVIWGIGASTPTIDVVPVNDGLPAVAGGLLPLRARITSGVPGIVFNQENSVVFFYADDVYIGAGDFQSDGTYLLNWRIPEAPRTYAKIYAYLSAPNRIIQLEPLAYANSVTRSKNFLTVTTIDADALSVALTKPANNATNAPGVPLLLEATASAPAGQGTISKVEFYQNGEQIGLADTNFPYQANFTPLSPGRYTLAALAYSTAGIIQQSAPVTNNVVTGNAPTSFLTTSTSATATATVSGGQINTPLTITRGGSGYTNAPAVRFVGGGGSNAVAVATINTNSGSVTNIAVSPRGSGYTNAPTVVIDPSPVAVSSNSTVLLQASAADTDGTIRQVDFLQNGVIVGTATGLPYNFNLPVTAAGRYELVARATDNLGNVTDSPVIVLNGTSGKSPTVSIVNPANTTPVTEVTPGIPVAVTANASDTDGSVARVDLIVNGVVVGFSTQAPYIFTDAGQFSGGSNTTFTPTSEGTYVIVARATDNLGNVTDSASVTVRAKSAIPVGVAPTVQITQPIGEIYYVTGSSLFLNARATDAPPGEVDPDSVDFTVNGLAIPGAVIGQIGNDYGVRYTPTTPFTIDTIRAQATDDDGNTTYSQPNYTVLTLAQAPLPQVQMLDLLPSTPLDAGGVIKLRAEAFFPPTASQQSRVEFYANNVYVGTATQDATNPRLYTLDWESPETPAAYVIEARAVALNFQTNVGEGNVIEYFGSVISDNNIAVNTIPGTAPDVEITAPINGSTVAVGQPLTIRATAFVPSPSGPSVTEVTSPQAGTVTSVRVAVGQAIIVGTPLVDIQVAPGFSGTVSSTLVGTVKSIKVVPSSAVTVGSVLLEVIPVTTVTAPSAAAGGTVTSVVPVGTLVQAGSPLVGVTLPGGFTGTINSPITGVVTQVSVTVGNTLTNGQSVARIEPGGGSSGTIASVEFYANGVLLGVDNTAPYSIDFTPNSIGLYNLNAIAYSNAGLVSTSATISVSATLGSAPVVTITRPTQATATATLGTGSTAGRVTAITAGQLGSGYTTAPLVTLSAPPPGGVQATATAVLGTGASAGRITSYTITNAGVGYTAAPTVTVASPSGTLGSSLLVQASVSDSDGIITQVEFLVNGLVVQTLTAAPYSYNLPLASTGTYLLQVRATDNSGNVGVSAVEQFIVNQGSPPSVSITSPVNGATVSASQPLTVTANASDTDGSVVSVTFFQNGTQIGEPDTQAPYSATFTPGSSGQYTLVALAQDNSGNLTQSTPVVVTVPSTVVTTSVVSPTNGASFTLGTPVILTATASTTAGATISSVRFEVNSQPVGAPITSAPYTASFVPTALGSYTVRAIATDTSGGTGVSAQITFTVNNPVGSAPSIWLSQPSQGNYLTAGSSVFLNYTTFDTEGEIDPATLRIFVNGVALTNPAPQRIGPDGNTFGVRWNPGVTGTYVVSAQVSDFDGNTASSGTSTINVLPAQKTVPQVTIEPFVSASQYISVGLPIELRAKAKFFANTDPQVEFYANGVFVGTGVAGASNSDGSVSYSFVWTPDVAGTAITLTARAVGINFEQTEFVTPPGSTDTTIIRRNVYASSISSNRPTPPVTDLTINQVPADPAPGSNEAFVKFIFPTIFNRPATYAEYIYYVNQLQPFGNPATSSARATVIQELMGTVEYNSSYNVVYSFYYRLGLTPTRAAAATQIDVVKNNTAAETGFATHTTAQPQAPNLPTLGMSLAAQNLLGTLGNQTTVGLTPNVTKPLSQFSNIEFLNWLIPKLGGQAFNPSQMVSSMNTYSPQLRRQGSALAFLTQLYATYAAIDQNIADSRPTAVGPVNPNFRQDNLNYDAKLKGITINFLLTGVWSTSTAPLSNSMLASLLTSSAAAAKPVVTSGNASGDVAEYFTYQIEATNSPGGYTASNLPTWLRLNPETGLLTGRPGLGDDGIYLNVKVGAQNWAGEGTKFITIEIAPAPTAMSMAMLKAKYSYPSAGALGFGVDDSDAAQVRFRTVPGGLELVWTQLKNPAAYGVTYLIQQSAGLNNGWTPVTLAPGQVPQPVNDGVSVPDVDDYERVRVTLPISGSKGFYRVKATVPQ